MIQGLANIKDFISLFKTTHSDPKRLVYSKIDEIPKGHASNHITPGCIVLEGGAFRALYGEGVVDALMEEDVNLETTVGVSGGALNGLSYVSGQIGRSARVNLRYRNDPDYVGYPAWVRTGSIIGFDRLFDELCDREPLDKEAFYSKNRRFYVTTTNCVTGEEDVYERSECDIFHVISASCSMPYVSRMVDIDGQPHLDGGCHTKIPYTWAIKQGYEKIIIVRTRPRAYRKGSAPIGRRIARLCYQDSYPKLADRLVDMNAAYNRHCDEIEKLEKEGRVFVISPSGPVNVSRLETDMEKLGDLYYMGYNDTKRRIDEIKAYLGMK